MRGAGQQAGSRAARVCRRRRATPATPGAAWGPPCSANRRDGTASPRGVLPGNARPGEAGSPGDATGGGGLTPPPPRGQPGERRTCAQTWGRSRGASAWRRDAPGAPAAVARAHQPLAAACAAGLDAPHAPRSRRTAWCCPPSPPAADPPAPCPRGPAPGGAPGAPSHAGQEAPGRRSARARCRATRHRPGGWRRPAPPASRAATTTPGDASSPPSPRALGSAPPGGTPAGGTGGTGIQPPRGPRTGGPAHPAAPPWRGLGWRTGASGPSRGGTPRPGFGMRPRWWSAPRSGSCSRPGRRCWRHHGAGGDGHGSRANPGVHTRCPATRGAPGCTFGEAPGGHPPRRPSAGIRPASPPAARPWRRLNDRAQPGAGDRGGSGRNGGVTPASRSCGAGATTARRAGVAHRARQWTTRGATHGGRGAGRALRTRRVHGPIRRRGGRPASGNLPAARRGDALRVPPGAADSAPRQGTSPPEPRRWRGRVRAHAAGGCSGRLHARVHVAAAPRGARPPRRIVLYDRRRARRGPPHPTGSRGARGRHDLAPVASGWPRGEAGARASPVCLTSPTRVRSRVRWTRSGPVLQQRWGERSLRRL
jgi:hypothetical protein